ncbi:serine hydrolase domain-containing protein [Aquimarina sp. SS2-1]|uniref:serine hydrolase domain-containing protein n=1 Tax=Aquimarina besae TaxID=3342247 RepID=UPI00366B3DCB
MKNIIVLITFFLCSVFSIAQIKQSQAIDSIFYKWDNDNTPGCAMGIIKNGELIYAKGYGIANMEYKIPNSTSSVFRIGSTSKQFTAACVVLLAEQGKLKFENTLKNYFPDFPEYANKITVRHLLNHTSGIRDYLQLAYLKGLEDDDFYTDNDIMEWLVNQTDLNFAPGKEYLYSNSGYWLLGQIVKEVAGTNMAEFAQKEIFEPLEMHDTHFHNDHTRIVKNRASGYIPSDNNSYKISMTTLDMIGDGGIFTTINDIKKWDDAFYDSNVLSKEFWKMMTKQGVLNNGETIDYASGLMIGEYKGLKTIRHGGAFVGFRAELLRFPEQKLSIAIFANRGDANPSLMANQVADIILEHQLKNEVDKKEEREIKTTSSKEFSLKQIAGAYEIQPGVTLKLSIQTDSLRVLQTWNQSSYNIVRIKGSTFQIPGEEGISFTFSDLNEDQTQTLSILQGGRKTKASRKKQVDLSQIKLTDYVGKYYSKELDVTYIFELNDEALKLKIDNKKMNECTVEDIDKFVLKQGVVKFQRTNDVVSGFELDSGRVKNLKFEKQD